MTPFTTFLVATDFSVDGNNAVRRAALLAHEQGARLHILHVLKAGGCRALREWFSPTIDIDLKAAQASSALRRVAVEVSGAYDVIPRVEVVVGDPFETLLKASEHAALVVLGRRGHSRLETLLIGRTADRMLRICRRPVLVVKTPVRHPYRRVLMPVDFTASSDAAVQFALPLVHGARVHVFHAADTHQEAVLRRSDVAESVIREVRARRETGTSARMRRKFARSGLDISQASFSVGRGPAAPETLRQAATLGADLVVAGKHGRSTLGDFLLGSVSSRVLSESACDVLIVPRPRDGSPRRGPSAQAHAAEIPAPSDAVVLARNAARQAGASRAEHCPRNTARFLSRRTL
jgi:nucleotide-binding universal stress UspA family protein